MPLASSMLHSNLHFIFSSNSSFIFPLITLSACRRKSPNNWAPISRIRRGALCELFPGFSLILTFEKYLKNKNDKIFQKQQNHFPTVLDFTDIRFDISYRSLHVCHIGYKLQNLRKLKYIVFFLAILLNFGTFNVVFLLSCFCIVTRKLRCNSDSTDLDSSIVNSTLWLANKSWQNSNADLMKRWRRWWMTRIDFEKGKDFG